MQLSITLVFPFVAAVAVKAMPTSQHDAVRLSPYVCLSENYRLLECYSVESNHPFPRKVCHTWASLTRRQGNIVAIESSLNGCLNFTVLA